MKSQEQNYDVHRRLVIGFHIVTLGLIVFSLVLGVIELISGKPIPARILEFTMSVVLVLLFVYIRSFATSNQDRIIRCEENFRCYRLTGKELDPRLTRDQVIALRFASDKEFEDLAKKAIQENLTQDQIKRLIKDWRPDFHRV